MGGSREKRKGDGWRQNREEHRRPTIIKHKDGLTRRNKRKQLGEKKDWA